MAKEVQAIEVKDVNQETAVALKDAFNPQFQKAKELEEAAKAIVITSEEQTDLMEQARTMRLSLKDIRVNTEAMRKELKAESLRKGKAIDGVANIIKFLIVPIEEHLQKQEDFIKVRQEEKIRKRLEDRISKIESLEADTSIYNVAEMTDEAFGFLVETLEKQLKEREGIAKKQEEDRIENERLEKLHQDRKEILLPYSQWWEPELKVTHLGKLPEGNFNNILSSLKQEKANYDKEQDKIREDNERLKKEAAEKDKKAKVEAKNKAAKDLKAKKAQEKKDAELEAKLAVEKKEKDRLAKELQDKKDAEIREKERLEEEKMEEEKIKVKAEEDAKLAPDKEKLKKLADTLSAIQMPELKEEKAKAVLKEVVNKINSAVLFLKEKII